eukprot:NODE_212_length_14557_cov_0.357103.p10 type:complete len:111 gc:universal NODE_212_length_14557_cov_0.357103:4332-4664(+)
MNAYIKAYGTVLPMFMAVSLSMELPFETKTITRYERLLRRVQHGCRYLDYLLLVALWCPHFQTTACVFLSLGLPFFGDTHLVYICQQWLCFPHQFLSMIGLINNNWDTFN